MADGEGIKVANLDHVQFEPGNTILNVYDASNALLGKLTFTSPQTANYHASNGQIVTCFMPGIHVLGPDGEVAVESLKAGDLVTTTDGRHLPVRWIGRQTVSRVFGDRLRVLPIRIKAGALADNVPSRDL